MEMPLQITTMIALRLRGFALAASHQDGSVRGANRHRSPCILRPSPAPSAATRAALSNWSQAKEKA